MNKESGEVIVTIDGPAGAGKSSVARALARRLGYRFLDTGAMYRAVVYIAIRESWPLDVPEEVAKRSAQLEFAIDQERILVNGDDVTPYLREPDVTARIHHVADNAQVRARLVELQREAATGGSLVTEGRDQGTMAFPDADCKFFLTASPEERAKRRWRDLQKAGNDVELAQVVSDQEDRDRRDRQRKVGALVQAEDALVIQTDGKSFEQVVEELVRHVELRRSSVGEPKGATADYAPNAAPNTTPKHAAPKHAAPTHSAPNRAPPADSLEPGANPEPTQQKGASD